MSLSEIQQEIYRSTNLLIPKGTLRGLLRESNIETFKKRQNGVERTLYFIEDFSNIKIQSK